MLRYCKLIFYTSKEVVMRSQLIFNVLLIVVTLNLFCVKIGTAQDLHFAQFYNSPMNINAGKTGIFNGDKRFMASYRDQWRSVAVPWTTMSFAYDQKFLGKSQSNNFFSAGIYFNYDQQGISKLTLTNLNLSGSYTRSLNKNNLLTLGVSLGVANRGFDPSTLTWDRQWNGDAFDGNLASGENFTAERINFFENSIGLNYRWQTDNRNKLDVGLAAYHLLEPKLSYMDNTVSSDTRLPRRYSATAVGTKRLLDLLDLQLHGVGHLQGEVNQLLFGGLFKLHVNEERGKEFELHIGASYRTTKSLIPVVAIQYRNIYASFSYDIDLSEFQVHTNNRGGPELHFNYIITEVKPLRMFKACPIF